MQRGFLSNVCLLDPNPYSHVIGWKLVLDALGISLLLYVGSATPVQLREDSLMMYVPPWRVICQNVKHVKLVMLLHQQLSYHSHHSFKWVVAEIIQTSNWVSTENKHGVGGCHALEIMHRNTKEGENLVNLVTPQQFKSSFQVKLLDLHMGLQVLMITDNQRSVTYWFFSHSLIKT